MDIRREPIVREAIVSMRLRAQRMAYEDAASVLRELVEELETLHLHRRTKVLLDKARAVLERLEA